MLCVLLTITLLSVPADLWDNTEYWQSAIPGRILIHFDNNIDVDNVEPYDLHIGNVPIVYKSLTKGNFIVVEVEKDVEKMKEYVKHIESQPHVEFAEPTFIRTATGFLPNDQYYSNQWGLDYIKAPDAWTTIHWPPVPRHWTEDPCNKVLSDVSIAFIETGIDYNHQDLIDRFGTIKGYDFLDNDNDPINNSPSEDHGTAVAGIAVATMDDYIGTAGVSRPTIYAVRVTDTIDVTSERLVDGINWAADHAQIINISYGGYGYSQEESDACTDAYNSGCILIASSGNHNLPAITYPAAYHVVIAVGAINSSYQRATWPELGEGSNYGVDLDLCAPGDNIMCPIPGNDYGVADGTSFAAPFVSGVVALLRAKDPYMPNSIVKNLLFFNAMDLGPQGKDMYFGWGLVDANRAVNNAAGTGICFNDDGGHQSGYYYAWGNNYSYVTRHELPAGVPFKVKDVWVGVFTPPGTTPVSGGCQIYLYDVNRICAVKRHYSSIPAWPSAGNFGWFKFMLWESEQVVFYDDFYTVVTLYNGVYPNAKPPYIISDQYTWSDPNTRNYWTYSGDPPGPNFYSLDYGDFMIRASGVTNPPLAGSKENTIVVLAGQPEADIDVITSAEIAMSDGLTKLAPPTHISEDKPEADSRIHFSLQNYPDPFADKTEISYSIPHAARVSLKIYDITGKLVNTLINTNIDAGTYKTYWFGDDVNGNTLSKGIYFCQLKADNSVSTKKVILVE